MRHRLFPVPMVPRRALPSRRGDRWGASSRERRPFLFDQLSAFWGVVGRKNWIRHFMRPAGKRDEAHRAQILRRFVGGQPFPATPMLSTRMEHVVQSHAQISEPCCLRNNRHGARATTHPCHSLALASPWVALLPRSCSRSMTNRIFGKPRTSGLSRLVREPHGNPKRNVSGSGVI